MDQLTKILEESNKRMELIIGGKYDKEKINHGQREAEIQLKVINATISAYSVAAKERRVIRALSKKNIMDDHTAVELPMIEGQIHCQEQDDFISKEDCLDYSGSHIDECQGCDRFGHTRNVILGDNLNGK